MAEIRGSMFCSTCRRQTASIRPRANHILHLILSLLSCGWWVPVWLLCALLPGAARCTVCGQTSRTTRLISGLIRLTAVVVLGLAAYTAYLTIANWK